MAGGDEPEAAVNGSDEYADIADLYDHVTLYRERTDVAFFVDAAVDAGGPVLELGCGSGRVLIPTAHAGVEIVGLDSSPSMLAVCRRRLHGEPPEVSSRVRLVQGDMRRFDIGARFSLVTIPFRPFQHLLTVEDQLACLRCIERHLTEGGRLIFDLFNPSLEALVRPVDQEIAEDGEFSTPDGRRVTRSFKIVAHDRFRQVNDVQLIYDVVHPNGRNERLVQAFAMRYLFRFEAEHLLARAGFVIEHLYAGYDMSEYGTTYPGELVFVATRTTTPATR